MPYLFIHGIGQRCISDGGNGDFEKAQTTRDILVKQLFLSPLSKRKNWSGLGSGQTYNPYWGNLGARERWNTIPKISIESLGEDATAKNHSLASDAEWAHREAKSLDSHEKLLAYLEVCVAPILHGEALLEGELDGKAEALLLLAIAEVADAPEALQCAQALVSDEAKLLVEMRRSVAKALVRLVESDSNKQRLVEEQGGPEWLTNIKIRIGELFDRAEKIPARTLSLSTLALTRDGISQWAFPRLGDVFVYLRDPEPFLDTVSREIREACKDVRSDEPLLILTHSMGGNLLYDLLTHYKDKYPLDRRVRAWISVGGQVGLFEAMKLFRASDPGVMEPQKLKRPESVDQWINVYDPADILAYKIDTVFEDVIDKPYSTGAGALSAHGDYFLRPSFYRLLLENLK